MRSENPTRATTGFECRTGLSKRPVWAQCWLSVPKADEGFAGTDRNAALLPDVSQGRRVEAVDLAPELQSQDAAVRREGLGVIGYLKADSAIPALMATANDGDPSVRRATMASLVFVRPGGPGSSALLAGLKDENWQVREQAALSIGKIRLPEAVDLLIKTIADDAWQMRVKTASALGRIRDRRSVPALGHNLLEENSNLRKEVAAALGEIADLSALAWLELSMDDPDPDVGKLIRWAIARCQAS